MSEIIRLSAFADGARGGNPAGVVIGDALPSEETMQRIAAEVGYSETAFAAKEDGVWRVRYFSPEAEVPFCGHATIALGAALAERFGEGVYPLRLNDGEISVEGGRSAAGYAAVLQSPPTWSRDEDPALLAEALALFGFDRDALDPRLPPRRIHGGGDHLALALRERGAVAAMRYDFAAGRALMRRAGWVTIAIVCAAGDQLFDCRNAFAFGGVYEDPATGAAAAAFAGYLRDIGWPHGGRIEIRQGDDMGAPSRLVVELDDRPGSSVRVSGAVRTIAAD